MSRDEAVAWTPRIFARQRQGRLQISAQACRTMRSLVLPSEDECWHEAGGILLGRWLLYSEDVIVDAVTGPLPGDQSGPLFFLRQADAHQVVVDRNWRATRQTMTYLGEWHTHPELQPEPSGVDLVSWQARLRDLAPGDALFFVIVGLAELAIWEGERTTYRIERLVPLTSVARSNR